MADDPKAEEERVNREADEALVEEIESRVDERAALVKHVLMALTAAGISLNCLTASVLVEVGSLMSSVIHEVIDDDD